MHFEEDFCAFLELFELVLEALEFVSCLLLCGVVDGEVVGDLLCVVVFDVGRVGGCVHGFSGFCCVGLRVR